VNLGEVGRQVGAHRAALGACLSALELTSVPRVRLPALGTAALAAARLGETSLLPFLARDVERSATRSGQPYENARAFVELAEAYLTTSPADAVAFATRAAIVADAGGFHEITLRADDVRADAARQAQRALGHPAASQVPRAAPDGARDPVPVGVRSAQAQAALRSLAALPGALRYAAAAT
jgi:hypothetical protein